MSDNPKSLFAQRFRGYFPVVIDVETAGFNANTDALLEIAASLLHMDETTGLLSLKETLHFHVEPFAGANLEPAALEFTGIDPTNPLRGAVDEDVALKAIFKAVRKEMKAVGCQRAIMVAHNAAFDNGFVNAATERCNIKRSPFHPFVTFDTATLSGLALGQTVLAKAAKAANLEFDNREAHSALYDTEKTAELFCYIINKWQELGGWPLPTEQSAAEESLTNNESSTNEESSANKVPSTSKEPSANIGPSTNKVPSSEHKRLDDESAKTANESGR